MEEANRLDQMATRAAEESPTEELPAKGDDSEQTEEKEENDHEDDEGDSDKKEDDPNIFDWPDPPKVTHYMSQLEKAQTLPKQPPFQFPGWKLPIDYPGHERDSDGRGILFATALSEDELDDQWATLPLMTLRELAMLQAMNAITEKDNWESKVFDDAIKARWRDELLSGEEVGWSDKMFAWMIAELQHKAIISKADRLVTAFDADVVKSDLAVPEATRQALMTAVKPLEDIPEVYRDWHPGSQERVLDLVHPSLFPLVYGRTRILPERLVGLDDCIESCGTGEILPEPPEAPTGYSAKFQWLPCDVQITGEPRIMSYINNLHPHKHQDLYEVIEQVIGKTILLWNITLTALNLGNKRSARIPYTRSEDEELPPEIEKTRPESPDDSDDYDDYYDRKEAWEEQHRIIKQPEPGEFALLRVPEDMKDGFDLKDEFKVDLRRDYSQCGLQIIVKLANIELSPQKPEYEGGSWHVEGQLNEHIVSTALYYYDVCNITDCHLAFRQQSTFDDMDIYYEQNDHLFLSAIFGCENDTSCIQELGKVRSRQGRLLTFPNTLQHRVGSFKLADPSKPGHRKVLALFLVDPNVRVISTANVPCQRADWWAERLVGEADGTGEDGRPRDRLTRLPNEVRDMIIDRVEGFPINVEEARALRLDLMAERMNWGKKQMELFEEASVFSLCEH